jgi:hypothetical protein
MDEKGVNPVMIQEGSGSRPAAVIGRLDNKPTEKYY